MIENGNPEVKRLTRAIQVQAQRDRRFAFTLQDGPPRLVSRRARVAGRFQTRVLKRILQNAGIDHAKIETLHASDRAAFEQFMRRQRRISTKDLKAAARRQDASIRWMMSRAIPVFPPPPPLQVRLDQAVDIRASGIGSSGGSAPVAWHSAPGQNVVTGYVLAQSEAGYDVHSRDLFFHFAWMSDRDGSVMASSQIWPLMIAAMYLYPNCEGSSRANSELFAALIVAQTDPAQNVQSAVVATYDLAESLTGPDSSGMSTGDTLLQNPIPLTGNTPLPIVSGRLVLCTVQLSLLVQCDRGWSTFAFEDRWGYRINVPFVDLYVA